MGVGDSGRRQAVACKVDALGMASCMPICRTLLLASCKSWETLKQQPLVGHLSLDSLPYFTFFFGFLQSLNSQLSRQPTSSSPSSSLRRSSLQQTISLAPRRRIDDPPSIFLSSPSSDYDPVILFIYIC